MGFFPGILWMGKLTWCRSGVVVAPGKTQREANPLFIPDFHLPGASAGIGEVGKPTGIWDEGF